MSNTILDLVSAFRGSTGNSGGSAATADTANAATKIQNPALWESNILRSPKLFMYYKFTETVAQSSTPVDYGTNSLTGTYDGGTFGSVLGRNAWRFRYGGSGFTKTNQNNEGVRLIKPDAIKVNFNQGQGPTPLNFNTVFRYTGGGTNSQPFLDNVGFGPYHLYLYMNSSNKSEFMFLNDTGSGNGTIGQIDVNDGLPHLFSFIVTPNTANSQTNHARIQILVDAQSVIDLPNVVLPGSNGQYNAIGMGCWSTAGYGTWPGGFSDTWMSLRAMPYGEHAYFYRQMLFEIQNAN